MKILVTGSTGQVGYELCRSLSPFGTLLSPNRQQLDLSNAKALQAYLKQHQPDVVVNPAAWTAVDAAESQQGEAWQLNATVPAILAADAAERGSLLVHYSTDYVYPGDGETPWQETDATGPLSEYGRSKLAGDQAIIQSGCQHLIFRTSWVYAARGNNFMKTMLRLARQRSELSVVADQWGTPTPARLIADVTALALQRWRMQQGIASGVYHLATRGCTNWHQFATEIFALAAAQGVALQVAPAQVKPIPSSDYPTPALRPGNSRLQLQKLEQALGIQLPDWQQGLRQTLEDYLLQLSAQHP